MPAPYLLPLKEIQREIIVVNSRFIATLSPISSADEAQAFIKRIREDFADASHNAPAYVLGGGNRISEYCSDDLTIQGNRIWVFYSQTSP